jgi:ABC-type dipeptide/oligopeptide/nickel transport system permease component
VKYLVLRLSLLFPVALCAGTLGFFLMRLLPGDPAELMLGDYASADDVLRLRQSLGLDQPILSQLVSFWSDLLRGSWGTSLLSKEPIFPELWKAFLSTFWLSLTAWLLCTLVSLIAVWKVHTKDRPARTLNGLALALIGVPIFVWSPFLVQFLGAELRWLPVSGNSDDRAWVLPVLCLSVVLVPQMFRQLLIRVLDLNSAEFLSVARSKGVGPERLFWIHRLPVALSGYVPYSLSLLSGLLAGSMVVEMIFDWPGLGRLLLQSFQNRDYPTVQAILVFSTFVQVTLVAASDLIVKGLDPRVDWSASQ